MVVRRADGKVRIKQSVSLAGTGGFSGAFWGMLIGTICMMSELSTPFNEASGKLIDLGIDNCFINDAGSALQPGTSALFLLIHHATPDKFIAEVKEFGGTITQTNLAEEDEAALQEAFAAA
jgi:uncharacterized membrane protein